MRQEPLPGVAVPRVATGALTQVRPMGTGSARVQPPEPGDR